MSKSKYKFEEVCKSLLMVCEELGRIPKKKEINENKNLPHDGTIRELFKKNGSLTYNDYCESFGYFNSKHNFHTFDSLKESWEMYFEKYNKFPTTYDYCNAEFNIPSHQTIMQTLGDRKEEFFAHFKEKENAIFRGNYNKKCEEFKQFCLENNKVPSIRELTILGFPQSKWFVTHSLDRNIKDYSDFVVSLGLKPNYNIPKETTSRLIYKKANELNRTPMYEDFCGIDVNMDIGINVIKRIWGTFNDMLIDLGFEINQENMMIKSKSIEEMKDDIRRLCRYIEETENRNVIAMSDIDSCEWCLDSQTYNKHFKEKLNLSLVEYINQLGYDTNKCGMGMVYVFKDGEKTTSIFEFDVSTYLRENNISYERNIRYDKFTNHEGNKDCDYVINHNGKVWYVEIAGMLDYRKVSKTYDDPIRKRYKEGLNIKINLLKSNNLNFNIIYPEDLQTKPLNEVFSFLL